MAAGAMTAVTVRILEVTRQTHDVVTIRLDRPPGFTFIPGQHCLVSLPDAPQFSGVAKPFTFSCSPDQPWLELTIKETGAFTGAICACRVGDPVGIRGPFGSALTFDGTHADDLVMLSGGSGITPFISILRFARDRGLSNRMLLLYANRTEEDIIFRDELDRMPAPIRVVHFLSAPGEGWVGERGRISRDKILEYAGTMTGGLWYLCGPPPMNKSMQEILDEIGIPAERRRFDRWEIPGKSPA
jgi:ferredoxin-NADP reductase